MIIDWEQALFFKKFVFIKNRPNSLSLSPVLNLCSLQDALLTLQRCKTSGASNANPHFQKYKGFSTAWTACVYKPLLIYLYFCYIQPLSPRILAEISVMLRKKPCLFTARQRTERSVQNVTVRTHIRQLTDYFPLLHIRTDYPLLYLSRGRPKIQLRIWAA